jgi:hypothetical protein
MDVDAPLERQRGVNKLNPFADKTAVGDEGEALYELGDVIV